MVVLFASPSPPLAPRQGSSSEHPSCAPIGYFTPSNYHYHWTPFTRADPVDLRSAKKSGGNLLLSFQLSGQEPGLPNCCADARDSSKKNTPKTHNLHPSFRCAQGPTQNGPKKPIMEGGIVWGGVSQRENATFFRQKNFPLTHKEVGGGNYHQNCIR